ncbi:MAG: 3-hydroxybutyrate dehydrogenase [Thermoleophilaceae bacterium]|jgi:3-hydroxybutyrate dehydrogenase|nr:3-hydroxybutyrate dehydrogenase [Thermoleophilaceae bacterium]MEA2408688.1 3-hydroxybutyrate dehydrogenase [Thermoleophilaceae bacterium]
MTDALHGTALVTGAAGGIGSAICERLVSAGMNVLAVDLTPGHHSAGTPFVADLSTHEGNRDAVAAAVETFGGLDAVIPNAGVQEIAPIQEFPEDAWDLMLALMLTSPFLLARYAWPYLVASSGRIVAVASVHGLVASPYKSAYVSAKHGLLGLIKTLALEGAEHGVTATAVCPGFVRTPLVDAQIAGQARQHAMTEDRVLEDVILAPHAIKRLIEPLEVANVVAFLLGPSGAAFTGAPLPMDLGWTAR